MAIKHATTKTPGQKVFAVADWNANHTFLQTDIDHNQITNTHNLTNDIDHNLLTNYAANRHFLESEISHINILNIGTNTHAQIDTHISSLAGNHIPPGVIEMYGAAAAPTGWLLCNGAAVNRITYAALFVVIGETYGAGNGSTTFNTPNFASKFPRGNTAGATGGSDDAINVTHTHTNSVGNQSASHNHIFTGGAMANHGHADTFAFSGNALGNHGHADNFTTATQSASHTHDHDHALKNSGVPSTNGTSNQSASHYHTHDHANKVSTLNSVDHSHTFTGVNRTGNINVTSGGWEGINSAAGVFSLSSAFNGAATGTSGYANYKQADFSMTPAGTIGDQSANHNHWVNLPSINSGNQSASHKHDMGWHTHEVNLPNKTSGNQSASHTHTVNGAVTAASAGTPTGSITGGVTVASAGTPSGTLGNQSASHNHIVTIDNAGSSGTNANIPAYLGVNFIIKF